jgi:VCBS repeat-containing protein
VFIDDGHGGAIIPFVVTFNSSPVIEGDNPSLYFGGSFSEVASPGAPVGFGQEGAFGFFDPDPGDLHTVSAALNYQQSTVAPATTFTVDLGNDGLLHWHHMLNDSAMPYLHGNQGEQRKEVFDITIADDHGGTTTIPFTITFNSAPVFSTPTFDYAYESAPTAPHFLGAMTDGTTTELRFDFSDAVANDFPFENFIIDGNLPFFDPDHDHHAASVSFSPQDSSTGSPLGHLFADSLHVFDDGPAGYVHFQYGGIVAFTAHEHVVDAFTMNVSDGHGGITSHLFKFDLMA